jgi:cyclic pyranopterin phosphate synthase
MTTNGQLLAELAQPLRAAGLGRLNISVDTLDPDRFRLITRRGDLGAVLDGIEASRAAGFRGTKINAVVMGGVNDGEDLPALCRFAWARDLTPRFIEFMPMSEGALFTPGEFTSAAQIRARLEAAFGPLADDDGGGLPGVGPARYRRVRDGAWAGARVGVIAAVTEPFCDTCNRMRLSATGRLHTCLALDDDQDLRTPLRAGASDRELIARVRAAVSAKKEGHQFTTCGGGGPRKHMVAIGG